MIIVVTTIINPFMTSGSSKWLIIAPMIVPMFTMLNVHPAYAQLAYRIGDSATNICSPLQELLPVIIGMLTQYQEEGKSLCVQVKRNIARLGLVRFFLDYSLCHGYSSDHDGHAHCLAHLWSSHWTGHSYAYSVTFRLP